MTMPEDVTFMVTTLYGASTERALVQVEAPKLRVQMTTHEARALAWNLLASAEAADQEAFVAEFIGQGDTDATARVLRAFREWRDADRERAQREGREGA